MLDYTRPIRVKGTHEKVEILRTDLPGDCPVLAVITMHAGDQYAHTFMLNRTDWENVPAPKRSGTVWVNVYDVYADDCVSAHSSRAHADEYSNPDRLACVEVKWTEGEGL
jgi:hypothetical protein